MKQNKFVIYLDIDGVLVSYLDLKEYHEDGHHAFKPQAVETLNNLISLLDADICIISAWISFYKTDEEWTTFLNSRGIIVDRVYRGDSYDRPKFILEEEAKGITEYLIIDDEAFNYYQNMPEIAYARILRTNSYRCLDEYDFFQVLKSITRLKNMSDDEKQIKREIEYSVHKDQTLLKTKLF